METSFLPLLAYGDFFRRSRAAKPSVGGPIRLKFDLVGALMYFLITCKYEKDRIIVFSIITLWELSVAMETSSDLIWPKT